MSSFESMIQNEVNKFNDRQQHIFNFDLIKRVISNNRLNDNEIDTLNNMLTRYIDNNHLSSSDISTIINKLRNQENLDNGLTTKFNEILNNDKFNTQFFNDLDNISFTNNIDRSIIESIHKYFGKEYYRLNVSGNGGFAEERSYELLVKSGYIFRDPSKFNNLFIPQINGIDLGNYVSEYRIKGYQYKNPKSNFEHDKINLNGIGKYIQGENRNGENAMTNVLNVLIDHQKNTYLPNQLNELNRYLIELRKSNEYKDVTDKKKSIQDF